MAILQTTPPISFTDIKTVFSGSNNFSDYIRGGLYVPNTTLNSAISLTASGLAMSQFYGTGIPAVITASASPTAVTGSANTSSTVIVTTGTTTITASGGTGTPYTYAWTYVSGSGPLTMTTTANVNQAYWSGSVAYLASYQNVYKCTVTDSAGNTGSVNVTATISNG